MDDADFDMINNLMHPPIEPVSAEQIARNNAAVVVAVDAWGAAHAGPDAANAVDVGLAAAETFRPDDAAVQAARQGVFRAARVVEVQRRLAELPPRRR